MNSSLFQPSHVDDYVLNVRKAMCLEVDRIPAAEIVKSAVDELAATIARRHHINCPVLSDDISIDCPPFSPGIETVTIQVHVPFNGDHDLFRYSGGSAPIITEPIDVHLDHLAISMRLEKSMVGDLEARVKALVKRIGDGLASIEDKLKYYNPDLKKWAALRIQERQAELACHDRLLGDLQKTSFTIRRRNDGNEKIIVPVRPKVITIPPTSNSAAIEPELSLTDYDEILGVIRSMVAVFERSPTVFKSMEEEHLRTILLVALNGVFKGEATGETFNGTGKTDILIRASDNNIFIAECLIWDGPEGFRRKLTDQLFRYATWRDSKLAAIVFNRNKDFSGVVKKMREVAGGLSNQLAELPFPMSSACRYKYKRADDPQKQFVLTCMAFEVPS